MEPVAMPREIAGPLSYSRDNSAVGSNIDASSTHGHGRNRSTDTAGTDPFSVHNLHPRRLNSYEGGECAIGLSAEKRRVGWDGMGCDVTAREAIAGLIVCDISGTTRQRTGVRFAFFTVKRAETRALIYHQHRAVGT